MNKYYFVNIGAEVIWHPVNSDEQKVMQICTSVSYPVENDTLVSLIFSDKRGSVKVKASELTPKLTDFNQGYWCALQDAVSNGASDTVIQEILRSAGFTYWECYWHIQNSDFQSEKIWSIIRGMFCQNPDYIDWNGADYPIKTVVILENTPDEEKVTVSVERLSRQLLDDMGNWSTREAESVDEQIYFYLDEETFNMPDEDIVEYLEKQ